MQITLLRGNVLFRVIFIYFLFFSANSFSKGINSTLHAENTFTCDVPSGITITNITKTNATVLWTVAAGALDYQIRFREMGAASWSNLTTTSTGKTLTGLIPFTEYEAQVQAVCNTAQTLLSGFSSSVYFTTEADTILLRGPYLQVVTQNSILVRWRTNIPTDSKVFFGTTKACAQSIYDATLTNEHIVKLSGLQIATKYYYTIGTSAQVLQGDASNYFVTALPKGSTEHFRCWVTGDFGKSSVAQTAVRDAFMNYNDSVPVNVWLWLGDNAYENGTDAEFQQHVFDKYPEQFKNIPFYPAIGNHDYSNVGYVSEQARGIDFAYFTIFSTPANGEAGGVLSGTPKYYSFEYGNVHFVALDSYGVYNNPGSEMYQWLDADLAANTQRFTIIYFHHPPYTMISHNSNNEVECIDIRNNLVPLFDKHHVDLVLSGHAHGNERSYLIKGHTQRSEYFNESMIISKQKNNYIKHPSYNGTVYAVCGSSAQNIGTAQSGFPLRCMAYSDTVNNCSMVIDVHADTLNVKYLASDNSIADNFSITKNDFPILPDTNGIYCSLSHETLQLNYLKQNDNKPLLKLVNISGETVHVFDETPAFQKSNYVTYELTIPNKNISEGVYFLTVDESGKKSTCKVVYLK